MFFDIVIAAAGLSAIAALVILVNAAEVIVSVWFDVNASSPRYDERRNRIITLLNLVSWFGASSITGATLLAIWVS